MKRQMAIPPWEDDPWLRHTRGSRLRLIAAYGIACVVIVFFLLLLSFAG